MLRFASQTVVVVGAANGVGRSAAIKFAEEGANVVLLDLNIESGQQLESELQRNGCVAKFWKCDWTSAADLRRVSIEILKEFRRVDCLYNHAGTVTVKPFLECSDEDWQWMFDVNLFGMVRSIRTFLPAMLKNGGGTVVNMASISGLTASPLEAAYCASKGACIQLTRAIAVEYRDRGLRCNAVCPGFIRTDHGMAELRSMQAHGAMDGEAEISTLQGRMADPEEVADVVLFLASNQSRFVNGEMLVVDNAALAST